jgi:hypothetical protein
MQSPATEAPQATSTPAVQASSRLSQGERSRPVYLRRLGRRRPGLVPLAESKCRWDTRDERPPRRWSSRSSSIRARQWKARSSVPTKVGRLPVGPRHLVENRGPGELPAAREARRRGARVRRTPWIQAGSARGRKCTHYLADGFIVGARLGGTRWPRPKRPLLSRRPRCDDRPMTGVPVRHARRRSAGEKAA